MKTNDVARILIIAASVSACLAFVFRRRKYLVRSLPPVLPPAIKLDPTPEVSIESLVDAGFTAPQIAIRLNKPYGAVKQYCLKHNLVPISPSEAKISILSNMAAEGRGVDEIANALCLDKTYVRYLARKHRVRIKGYKPNKRCGLRGA